MAMKAVTANLEELRAAMIQAKAEDRPKRATSLREAIGTLLPEIEDLRKARWSDAEIAEWMGKRGMAISAGTLAQYVREARRTSGERRPVRPTNGKGTSSAKVGTEAKASVDAGVPHDVAPKALPMAEGSKQPSATKNAGANASPSVKPNAAAAASTKRRVNDDA